MVLCYHAISDGWPDALAVPPGAFEQHIRRLLSRGFKPADAEAAVRHRKSLHVTFDDAYRSVLHVIPILERLSVPATIFACSELAETGAPFAVPELTHRSAAQPEEVLTLGWERLRELAAGGVGIGSHTHTHPHLTLLSDEELHRELAESRERIESEVGRPCPYLAYPYGEQDLRVRKAAKAAGYAAAFALEGSGGPLAEYGLPRVDLYRKDGSLRLALKTSLLRRGRQGGGAGRSHGFGRLTSSGVG
jgi:peptidoglycan/xylan/chitin deacetylase (PgdA/CDA1 family)